MLIRFLSLSRASESFRLTNFGNHSFILPSAISWEWKSVTAIDILWINFHSRFPTDTYYYVQKVIRNGVWYAWYFHVVSAAILLPFCLIFFKINYLVLQFAVKMTPDRILIMLFFSHILMFTLYWIFDTTILAIISERLIRNFNL